MRRSQPHYTRGTATLLQVTYVAVATLRCGPWGLSPGSCPRMRPRISRWLANASFGFSDKWRKPLMAACPGVEDLPLIPLQSLEQRLHVGRQGAFKPE